MKRLALLTVMIGFALGACESHDFEGPNGTKQLHEHHGAHDDHGDHGEEHHEDAH